MSEIAFMDHFQQHVPFLLTSVVTPTCHPSRQCFPRVLLLKGQLLRFVQYRRLKWNERDLTGVFASIFELQSLQEAHLCMLQSRYSSFLSNTKTDLKDVKRSKQWQHKTNTNCTSIHLLKQVRLKSPFYCIAIMQLYLCDTFVWF